MRINEDGWYPSYIDPDDTEIMELAQSHWDTVRILIVDDKHSAMHESVILASGYGNTHETLVRNIKRVFEMKRAPFTYDYILYKRCGSPLFNDISAGRERVKAEEFLRECTPKQQQILSTLIQLSDLRYDS